MSIPADRVLMPISDAELNRRWTLVRKHMEEQRIDALLMQNSNDWMGGYVKWFTDIPANNGYPRTVIFHRNDPMTIVEMGARGVVKTLNNSDPVHRGVNEIICSPLFYTVAYSQGYDAEIVIDLLKKRGYRTIGLVNGGSIPYAFAARVTEALSAQAKFVDATEFIDHAKAIKSAEEIERIRACAKMQDAVFAKVVTSIKPGMRDIDVTALAQQEGQVRGSEQGIFLGASAPLGTISPFLPRHMQGHKLQKGDHLSLLIENNGGGGFFTEIARTIVLGKASNEIIDGFEAVREAQDHTLAMLKPGVPCRDIATAHDTFMTGRGLPPELRLYAHGQGYDMVERPLIRSDETMRIEAGMNLAVHPGYETPSLFAVICDNYVVTDAGAGACLHKTEKKVFELG